jgi:16S rRNA (guanine1207-N2)-methyltransferase
MFSEAQRVLGPGGELLVVGNQHLAYHAKLTRLFGKGRVDVVASDPKFVVLRATA